MNANNPEQATPVIRTDFTDEAAWQKIKQAVAAKYLMGFSANVRFIDDRQYSGLSGPDLTHRIPGLQGYGCIFIADATAMSAPEHHLLVLDPSHPAGESEAWGVENNLSLANMDYGEFANTVDPDGVFRGFKSTLPLALRFSDGWGGILGWTVANGLGVAVIGALALVLALGKPMPGIPGSALLIGLPLGLAQWIALRRIAPLSMLWVLTIPAGLSLGLAALNSPYSMMLKLFPDEESALGLTAGYIIIGLVVGLAQWLLLRGRFRRAWVWPLSSALGLGLGTALMLATNLINLSGLGSIILVVLVYSFVTGATLAWLRGSPG